MVYRRLGGNYKFLNLYFISHSVRRHINVQFILEKENIPIHNAIEIIAYCHFDGKVDQGSKFEKNLSENLLEHLKSNEDLTNRCLALCWIYFKLLGEFTKVRKD